jgi:hypothetical protein
MKRKFWCDPLLLPVIPGRQKAVPEAFAIISPEEAPHSEENPSKTSTAVKKQIPYQNRRSIALLASSTPFEHFSPNRPK